MGPLNLLYQPKRREKARATRADHAARRRQGEVVSRRARAVNNEDDYLTTISEILGWERSDLRTVREVYGSLRSIEAAEAAEYKRVYHEQGPEAAAALKVRYPALLQEVQRLENDGGLEGGGLYSLLKKLRWIVSGKDPADLKTGRGKRKVGEPTITQRKAATAANPTATGRELDVQTMQRLTQLLTNLGIEAEAYTHVRPSVRLEDIQAASVTIKAAVNQINRLIRMMRQQASYLEERPS